VVKIIKALEAHLISTGAIVTPVEIERNLQERNRGRWSRPTLKGSLAEAAEVHRLALAALRKDMTEGFARLEQVIQKQSGCLHTPIFSPPPCPQQPYVPPLQPSFVPGPYLGAPSTICATGEDEAAPCS
jgi:hypothetical protein